jgi:hypothetical protein
MDETINELEDLGREIRKIISDNKKFLDRVMEDDFEEEGEPTEADEDEAGTLVEL